MPAPLKLLWELARVAHSKCQEMEEHVSDFLLQKFCLWNLQKFGRSNLSGEVIRTRFLGLLFAKQVDGDEDTLLAGLGSRGRKGGKWMEQPNW